MLDHHLIPSSCFSSFLEWGPPTLTLRGLSRVKRLAPSPRSPLACPSTAAPRSWALDLRSPPWPPRAAPRSHFFLARATHRCLQGTGAPRVSGSQQCCPRACVCCGIDCFEWMGFWAVGRRRPMAEKPSRVPGILRPEGVQEDCSFLRQGRACPCGETAAHPRLLCMIPRSTLLGAELNYLPHAALGTARHAHAQLGPRCPPCT